MRRAIVSVLPTILTLAMVGCAATTDAVETGEPQEVVGSRSDLACPSPSQNVSGIAFKQLSGGRSLRTSLRGSAYVRNLGFRKRVGIVYTTDQWATTKTAELQVGDNSAARFHCGADVEQWSTPSLPEIPLGGDGSFSSTRLEYAVFYDDLEHGASYWDNNDGKNYVAQQ